MSIITLGDLNFYHKYIKESVTKELQKVNRDVPEDIIESSIKKELSYKMKDEKRFKKEIESLHNYYL